MNEWVLIAALFVAAFGGTLTAGLLPDYVIKPLRYRAERKRTMERAEFERRYGSNVVAYFVKHDGFNR